MSGNRSNSSDDSAGPEGLRLPRGGVTAAKRRRGWEGEELELEREAPTIANGGDTHAAVDLNQFRNVQVGKGYQAKHVIRQRSGKADTTIIHDMTTTKPAPSTSSSKTSKKGPSKDTTTSHDAQQKQSSSKESSNMTRLQKYLQCEGLRNFRKELDSIESSYR
jgi:hypothetical protein